MCMCEMQGRAVHSCQVYIVRVSVSAIRSAILHIRLPGGGEKDLGFRLVYGGGGRVWDFPTLEV